jgi:hypothetical protein
MHSTATCKKIIAGGLLSAALAGGLGLTAVLPRRGQMPGLAGRMTIRAAHVIGARGVPRCRPAIM